MSAPSLETLTAAQWQVVRELDRFARVEHKFEPKELSYWYLLRFAIARQFDLAESKKMLGQFIAFQKETAAAKLEEWGPADADFRDIQSKVVMGFNFTSKNGFPVLIWRLGESKMKDLLHRYPVETVVRYFVQLGNRFINIILPIASHVAQRRIEKLYVVYDLKGADMLSFLSGKPNEFIKRFAEAGQLYYPNVLEKLYMVNAPMLFSAAWTVCKHLLHPTTQERIEISSGSNKEAIQTAIDTMFLPPWLGGLSHAPLQDNAGPWREALEESYALKTFSLRDDTPYRDYFLTKEERRSQDKTMLVSPPESKLSLEVRAISVQDLEDVSDATHIQVRSLKTARMVVSIPNAEVTH